LHPSVKKGSCSGIAEPMRAARHTDAADRFNFVAAE
jgi:hypothetical protein